MFLVSDDNLFAKRYIADGEIKRTIWETCRFKSLLRNRSIWIGDGCDACRERIELDAADMAVRANLLRHRAKETSRPATWFENVSTMKSELLESFIDGLSNLWRRIIRIENGRACGIVFRLRKLLAKCVIFCLPAAVLRIKDIRETAKTAVRTEQAQLFFRCGTPCPFELLHHLDGSKIACKDSTFATRRREVCLVVDGREVDRRFCHCQWFGAISASSCAIWVSSTWRSSSISSASSQRCSVLQSIRRCIRF